MATETAATDAPKPTATLKRDQQQALINEICIQLGIAGGKTPATIEDFWYQAGLAANMSVGRGRSVDMARKVLEKYGEAWDDDFAAEDGSEPSLGAYEALLSRIQIQIGRRNLEQSGGGIEDAEDDEEEEGVRGLAQETQILVGQADHSIFTICDYIDKGSIVLDPDWQRGYVWKPKKQKRFIESILLGLPIPSVLLFKEQDGKSYVIDGRQRLETVYRFRSKEKGLRFRTFGPKIPGWGEGEKLNDASNKYYEKMPSEWKNVFDMTSIPSRTFINLTRSKLYQIFRRYNTGAEKLNAAEIRNAVYQASPLHKMMFRLAGEQGDDKFLDEEERQVAAKLYSIMGAGKCSRYGRYDLIGRYFAFSHMKQGSVANATNEFMEKNSSADVVALRNEFIRVFNTTVKWYEDALVAVKADGKMPFHAFVSTMQLVSTREMLPYVDAKQITEEAIMAQIAERWAPFAETVLKEKQNSTNFWNFQKAWIEELRKAVRAPAAPPALA